MTWFPVVITLLSSCGGAYLVLAECSRLQLRVWRLLLGLVLLGLAFIVGTGILFRWLTGGGA